MTTQRLPCFSRPTLALAGLAVLAGCLETGPIRHRIGDRLFSAEVLAPEEQMFGGMETYLDENGVEQVLYWDGVRIVVPVVITAADGLPIATEDDQAAAREAAAEACGVAGFAGLEPEARLTRVLTGEGAAETVTAVRFDGCQQPPG